MPSIFKIRLARTRHKYATASVIVPLLFQLLIAPTVAADRMTFSLANIQSSGDYGLESDTRMRATVFKVSRRHAQGGFSLAIPYLDISGPATALYEDIDSGELFLIDIDNDHRSGLGDLVIGFDHLIRKNPLTGTKIRFGGSIKLATGDEAKGLGNGATDWSLFINARKRLDSNVISGQVGYQITGNNAFSERNNRLYAAANYHHIFNKQWGAGFTTRIKQASQDYYQAQKSISLFINHRASDAWSGSLRLGRGMSDSVSDYSLGIQLSYRTR